MSSMETVKRNNGLVLLYQAAMVLEQQQSMKDARMVYPITSTGLVSRPAAFPVSVGQRYITKLDGSSVPVQAVHLPVVSGLARRNSPTSRSSHNELEKTRRARLRQCLESLRELLPLSHGDASRMTMLNVLKKSCIYLRELESLMSDQRTRLRHVDRRRIELQLRRAHLKRVWHNLQKRAEATAAAAPAASAPDASSKTAATTSGTTITNTMAISAPVAAILINSGSSAVAVITVDRRRGRQEAEAVATAALPLTADPDAWRSRNASEISASSGSSEEEAAHFGVTRATAGASSKPAPAPGIAKAADSRTAGGESCDSTDSGYVSPQNLASNAS